MWSGWKQLESAAALAEMPHESLPACYASIQMLFGADLQWNRFKAALDAPWGSLPLAAWVVEAHFFLVAADNARDRLTVWAASVDEDEARGLAARLDNEQVKRFRHHQEHLEERMPGGRHEREAKLSSPGNAMIHLEAGGTAFAMNNLLDGRLLQFGDGEVDLAAAHAVIIDVAVDLLSWLEARSRFPKAR